MFAFPTVIFLILGQIIYIPDITITPYSFSIQAIFVWKS